MSNPKHGRWWDDQEPAAEPPKYFERLPVNAERPWGGFRLFPDRPWSPDYQAPLVGERMAGGVSVAWPGAGLFWWTGSRWLPLSLAREVHFSPDFRQTYLCEWGAP